MKKVERYQTFDGELHKSEKTALHHLDKMYGNAISNLSARLVSYTEGKYQRTQEYIDGNLELFVYLKQIKDDMQLDEMEENDDENQI